MTHRNDLIDNLTTALNLIDGSGAFTFSLETVERFTFNPISEPLMPLAFIHEGKEFYDDQSQGQMTRRLQVTIEAWADADGAVENLSERAGLLLADLERAAAIDSTLGDEALDTKLVSGETWAGDGGNRVGCALELELIYRTTRKNPNA
jgi:hypothetical protein